MGNMIDYLDWRGDLTFEADPFNPVDNLLLSHLSYVRLDGLAPGIDEAGIPLSELSAAFFETYSAKELSEDKSFIKDAPDVMKKMAESVRFQNTLIKNYINIIDVSKALQFSALEAVLDDGSSYIAFRGTDDTIIGWKEDFDLTRGVIPAEEEAVKYLNHIGSRASGMLRIGGHSKGGNLAVYASALCEQDIKERILSIYDNDGPGFTGDFLTQDAFLQIKSRIMRIIPEASIIGMLLKHSVKPRYVKSSQTGILQHDGFSWQVLGADFLYARGLSRKAALFNRTLDKWIYSMEPDKREAVTSDFFSVLEVTGAETLTELQNGGLKNIKPMLEQINNLSPETRGSVDELIKSLAGQWHKFL